MAILELIVRLIEPAAWPAAFLIIFFAFRKQLLTLLPSLRRVKAGPVEAEFEKEVQEISSEQMWRLPGPDSSQRTASRRGQLLEVARINPRVAVIDAWLGIELSLKKAVLQRLGGSSPPPNISSPVSMIRELAQEGSLDATDVSLLHELRGLRTQATHLPDFTPAFEAAQSYIELAIRIQDKLDALAQVSA